MKSLLSIVIFPSLGTARVLGCLLSGTVLGLLGNLAQGQVPPANDHLADAIVLSNAPVTLSGTTWGATMESGEEYLTINTPRSVWWAWTAGQTGQALLEKVSFEPLFSYDYDQVGVRIFRCSGTNWTGIPFKRRWAAFAV